MLRRVAAILLLAAAAASLRAAMVARIPGGIIEEYVAKAPPAYILAALDPALDVPLDVNHSHVGTDACGVEIIDAFSGERRRTTKQDVMDVARVADYLEAIAFTGWRSQPRTARGKAAASMRWKPSGG